MIEDGFLLVPSTVHTTCYVTTTASPAELICNLLFLWSMSLLDASYVCASLGLRFAGYTGSVNYHWYHT